MRNLNQQQQKGSLSLPKSQRLSSVKDIESLFRQGEAFLVYPIRCVYKVITEPVHQGQSTEQKARDERAGYQLQAMVSVPKRNHKRAVKRNLLKRRMREAYRLNKGDLTAAVTAGNNNLHVSFTYIAKEELEYEVIEKAIKKSLERIITKIGDCTTGAAD